MFELKQQRTKSGRDNFSPNTRLNLAAGAGHICSIYRCLKPSSCSVKKKDGNIGRVNLGVASHIYAAAGQGPRPAPEGMTSEQIGHHSNGIWTCRDCGNTIDSMECDYTPDDLFTMKRVRETAQKMAASDTQIRNMTRYISPIGYDDIFWEHLPDLDLDLIRDAILKLGVSKILERINQPRLTPTHLSIKRMVGCIRAANEEALFGPTTMSFTDRSETGPSNFKRRLAEQLAGNSESKSAEVECDDADDLYGDDDWDRDDDWDGDDPELEAIMHIQAMEERGLYDDDGPLSPKAMDQAEIYAGLRDPD